MIDPEFVRCLLCIGTFKEGVGGWDWSVVPFGLVVWSVDRSDMVLEAYSKAMVKQARMKKREVNLVLELYTFSSSSEKNGKKVDEAFHNLG